MANCGEPVGVCSFALDHSNLHVFLPLLPWPSLKPSLEVAINESWLLMSWEVLHDFQPFIGGFTLFFWATGTWWIPLLVIVGFWRHVVERVSPTVAAFLDILRQQLPRIRS